MSQNSKRKRLDEEATADKAKKDAEAARNRPKKKSVTGTSDSVKAGRKMKSPPADIFVWGVHPETAYEDIVNDLAESGIIITTNEIIL